VTATSFNSQTPVAIADQLLWANEFIPFVGTGNKLLGGEIQFTSSIDQELTMQLHQPFFRQGWWVLPAQVQPTAFIQLIQDNIAFDTVELRFSDANQPLRFKHPEQNWLFELHYVAQPNQGGYQLSIIRTPTGPAEAVTLIQNGSDFAITDTELAGRITIEQRLLLRAYRLPGLIFMVSGLIVLLGGIVLLALPPAGIIWLNTISKGRGSWVEAEAVVLNTLPPCVDPLTTHLVLPSKEVVDE
jgi:hypothetical protein